MINKEKETMKTTIYSFDVTYRNGETSTMYFSQWDDANEMGCFFINMGHGISNIIEMK